MDTASKGQSFLRRILPRLVPTAHAATQEAGAIQDTMAMAQPRGERLRFEIDVAVLGHTNYDNEDGAANRHPDYIDKTSEPEKLREGFLQSDLRGSMYYHEGLVYPGGTIPKPAGPREVNWDFSVEPMGSFFDRGWVVINNKQGGNYKKRPDPHLLSHTDYYLGGRVGIDGLTPADMISVVGLQHANFENDGFRRAVVAGTGRFAHVGGQIIQRSLGSNSSILQGEFIPEGASPPSPNFRITFDVWI